MTAENQKQNDQASQAPKEVPQIPFNEGLMQTNEGTKKDETPQQFILND